MAIKGGIRGKSLAPKVAIVDAAFTWSMPKKLTVETGFDALAHAIESYISLKANWHSENLSLQAIQIIGENLRKLNENLDDHEAREKMSYASMLMGMNLYNVGNCLPHRMQYPIGALTGTSHAAGLAAIYPAWLKAEYITSTVKVKKIFEILMNRTVGFKEETEKLMMNFLLALNMDFCFSKWGITKENLSGFIKKIHGDLRVDPIGDVYNICGKIYEEAL